ncbi:sugar ABC transporter permease [Mesorhizobium sp. CA18]|uniref:carbohydrate ABC transporter permease n=1 Tax=unclassified Mesorhizobium TaxID=325217 RepID=UPI001CCE3FB2|nr:MULTISPECIES: sugar ABC transporter permease [unclassified Mesorhizobium]MBZ9737041.1 sugar ABC transporter permease [Mesorhizobium sp. CA9]MBZ9828914.1 sugar ABC transporter permease [Mesorhizobium sp. CA18]MBZ9834639.1 sugar ABC transporter permease [Mesorhizobium sp. CA2]MBZ9840407.1 sugar ABC transporter permease [Mesorhizobium sp. CA3]MBZ9880420.1 sugar ABC transporter permease [Mesorhizobium sp. Ca11]
MRTQNATAYRFLTPYLLIFAIFWIWPIISSFIISFQATRTVPWRFAPAFNWGRLIGDPAFYNALKNTLLILVIQVPVMIALAIVMAVLLNSPLLKARGLYRFAFFAPVVVGEVAYSAVFRLMFSLDFGIVNKLLESVGISKIDWFSNETPAMALIMIAVTWRWAGYNAIIILAGLQSIPEDVYEAATLDRVSRLKQFFYITLPLLKPVIVFCAVLSIIGTMQLFTEPFLITERGGPGGGTETLGLLLYRQGFRSLNFGYASAVAYTMAGLAIAITLVQLWLMREPK